MRRWYRKFAVAFAGVGWAMRTQSSYWFHLLVTAVIIAMSIWLRLEAWRWSAIALAITIVLSAEAFNTSIELLARSVHPEHNEQVGRALDLAAGAVLLAAIGAVSVGLIVLGPPLWLAIF